MPLKMVIMASVTMNGCSSILLTKNPDIAPIATPTPIPTINATAILLPNGFLLTRSIAVIMDVNAATEPTEISMPPVSKMKVIPITTIPLTEI